VGGKGDISALSLSDSKSELSVTLKPELDGNKSPQHLSGTFFRVKVATDRQAALQPAVEEKGWGAISE